MEDNSPSESDQQYINSLLSQKESEEKDMVNKATGVIRYQWSVKHPNGEIFVVETIGKSIEDFDVDYQTFKSRYGLPSGTQSELSLKPANQTKYTCNICGGEMKLITGTSKTGNKYKIMRCIKFPETTQKGGHSRFIND